MTGTFAQEVSEVVFCPTSLHSRVITSYLVYADKKLVMRQRKPAVPNHRPTSGKPKKAPVFSACRRIQAVNLTIGEIAHWQIDIQI
jgi:hypothetical protein